MPRSKRRAPSSTNHHTSIEMSPSAHEEGIPRHPSKRLRHTSRYIKLITSFSHSQISQCIHLRIQVLYCIKKHDFLYCCLFCIFIKHIKRS